MFGLVRLDKQSRQYCTRVHRRLSTKTLQKVYNGRTSLQDENLEFRLVFNIENCSMQCISVYINKAKKKCKLKCPATG